MSIMFERDFTLKKYKKLCDTIIKSEYTPVRVEDYLSNGRKKCIILRHDVDRGPESALTMARLETELGINSTYYFRTTEEVFLPHIINEIEQLGHEIGYHYEVLDKTKGDREKAIKLFEGELARLRCVAEVKTAAMHGSPIYPWLNTDIWQDYDFRDFGIIGEPYLSIDYSKVTYLSDTGRSWAGKHSLKDVVNRNNPGKLKSTEEVIEAIRNNCLSSACLVVHPKRWNDSGAQWLKELVGQSIKNVVKIGISSFRSLRNDSKN